MTKNKAVRSINCQFSARFLCLDAIHNFVVILLEDGTYERIAEHCAVRMTITEELFY